MNIEVLFYILFFAQIVIISHYYPRKFLAITRDIIRTHPPEEYPKLYPLPLSVLERKMRFYSDLNLTALLIGLGILIHGITASNGQLLNWDNGTVITGYIFIQVIPILYASYAGCEYSKIMKLSNKSNKRYADLTPRKLSHYVSPYYLYAAGICYLLFIALVVYFMYHPFDGFAGLGNIAGVTFLNLFFATLILRQLYGKNSVPLMSSQDKFLQLQNSIKIAVFVSIAMTVHISLSIIFSAVNQPQLQDSMHSLYMLVIFIFACKHIKIDLLDFDVYKEKSES
ncbi:hypothetical protein [Flocculibacter collagenilyticus]|uniref:hypothetical protein n=1 Tax=Flocculibacter collagenilyticus TaxID=2744479 RepID=UPI0018F549BD|nr:hypothetical protein [Flocculibacter collagenilyticus]